MPVLLDEEKQAIELVSAMAESRGMHLVLHEKKLQNVVQAPLVEQFEAAPVLGWGKNMPLSYDERVHLLQGALTAVKELAFGCDEHVTACQRATEYLKTLPGCYEQMMQLLEGPVWDGDVIGKGPRDRLIEVGLATRVCVKRRQGYTAATYLAHTLYSEGDPNI